MPYKIKKVKSGYKVCKKNKPSKCFSKNPLTKDKAKKQMGAIIANESNESNENLYSWLSPSGKFYPIPDDSNHAKYGLKILNDLNVIPKHNVYYDLFKLGWQRITFLNRIVYSNNSYHKPNKRQLKELIDSTLLSGKTSIMWDNEEDYKQLWIKLEESKMKQDKYSVKGINIRGNEFNLYPDAYDVKDALKRATYHIIKTLNLSVEKDFGRIYSYILGNYYNGFIQVEKVPEQTELFDNKNTSFKEIFNEKGIKNPLKLAALGLATLANPVFSEIPIEDVAKLWSQYYQTSDDVSKERRALDVLTQFHPKNIPEDARNAINTAMYIFGGDMGISKDTLEHVLMATGAIESNYMYKSQHGGGPAQSYWQVEPETAIDLLLNSRPLFGNKFKKTFGQNAEILLNIKDKSPRNIEIVKRMLLEDDRLGASFAAAKWIAAAHKELKRY